jgi:flagellar biosynthesis protein FlhB
MSREIESALGGIFRIFSPKNLAKNWRFLLKLLLVVCFIIALVYEKNANFFR